MSKKRLQEELKQSMLAKDELRTSVLRLLLSAINYYEIQKGGAGYTASEEDVLEQEVNSFFLGPPRLSQTFYTISQD